MVKPLSTAVRIHMFRKETQTFITNSGTAYIVTDHCILKLSVHILEGVLIKIVGSVVKKFEYP